MSKSHPTQAARIDFFNEENMMLPFRRAGWRGCVLDRDFYNNARLPESLWSALVNATNISAVSVCGYFSSGESCSVVSTIWKNFSNYMLEPDNYSPEYVMFDESKRWAILADVDVTTLGCDTQLADRIDAYLIEHSTSLIELTLSHFSKEEILSGGTNYLRGVVGKLDAAP